MKYNGYEIDLPKRLKDLREQHGFTQPAMARLINDANPGWTWHQTTIAKIESGDRAIKVEDLMAYADVFFMMLDELLVDLGTRGLHDEAGKGERKFAKDYDERRAFMGDLAAQTKLTVKRWELERHRERVIELQREIEDLRG